VNKLQANKAHHPIHLAVGSFILLKGAKKKTSSLHFAGRRKKIKKLVPSDGLYNLPS
jgi:hypothetical protein